MFVSFFFQLSQTDWPTHRRRSMSFYESNFVRVLDMIERSHSHLIFFSDEPSMLTLCKGRTGIKSVFRRKESFWAWTQVDAIRAAMRCRHNRFLVPEFFSASYVALSLCKFQALADVSMTTLEPCVWIDAGLRETMLLDSVDCKWKKPGLHVTLFAPPAPCDKWITECPGAFVMGGCFGGSGPDVRRLHTTSQALLKELWTQGTSANDQQVLSLLYRRMPSWFHAQRAFTTIVPWIGVGKWNHALQILESESIERVTDLRWLFLLVIACAWISVHKNAS